MATNSLYYLTKISQKIKLVPNQLDQNIEENILSNLRDVYENKIIDNYIIIKITNIVSFNNGELDVSGLNGNVIYTVVFECYICAPTKGLTITCELVTFSSLQKYITLVNGPIECLILYDNSYNTFYSNVGDTLFDINTKLPISEGTLLNVTIDGYVARHEMRVITVTGKIISYANQDEINIYKKNKENILGIINSSIKNTEDFI